MGDHSSSQRGEDGKWSKHNHYNQGNVGSPHARHNNYDGGPAFDKGEDRKRRSSSPESSKKRKMNDMLEAERAARMARLRAENDHEESKLNDIEQQRVDNNEGSRSKHRPKEAFIEVDEHELDGIDESEQMQLLLGFTGGFGSTKGQKVDDNHNSSARGAAAKNKARKYRQYMNRKNGFNRPLEKMD
jgi:U4/U6.U5 tri-snRNP-associated protein 3